MGDQRSTTAVPWRKIRAALPAVALIGAGITFAAPVAPRDILGVAVSNNSSAIVVPHTALTMRAVLAPTQQHFFTGSTPKPSDQARQGSVPASSAAALVLPVGTQPGSSGAVALDNNGIPVRALQAYRKAASLVDAADATCHIDWALLAAIGRVESNHARFGGNQLDSAGVAQPGIIGIPLDGTNGTARIMDSDGGRLDRDTVYDRAVGPMQFIPSTWRVVGVDADGDGVKNPQDMADAATSTAIYLCSGPGDLNRPGDLRAAIMRYNASDSYVRTVTAIADAYRHGVRALPASDLPAANSAPTTSDAAQAARSKRRRSERRRSNRLRIPAALAPRCAGCAHPRRASPRCPRCATPRQPLLRPSPPRLLRPSPLSLLRPPRPSPPHPTHACPSQRCRSRRCRTPRCPSPPKTDPRAARPRAARPPRCPSPLRQSPLRPLCRSHQRRIPRCPSQRCPSPR